MIVLALEGGLGGFSASVACDGTVISAVGLEGNVALEAGLSAVREAMDRARVGPAILDRLAVGIGPGGFTGLRITLAFAKSLAQAWRLPLAGISSFDSLEYGLDLERALTVVVGRAGIVSLRYRDGPTERRGSGPVRETLAEVLPPADGRLLTVVGAPEDVFAGVAEAGFIVQSRSPLVTPLAAAVALAGTYAQPAPNAHAIRADYGEAPAAKIPVFRPTERKP